MLLGLRVTDAAGARIGFGRANGRHSSKYLSSLCLGIGWIMPAFDQERQAMHDKIASTYVLKGTPATASIGYPLPAAAVAR
jgi:uncharacterized RDD family membrane protein YckC